MKNKKKILIISHNFWPENFPINDFVKLICKKYEIDILTGQPNYPSGKIYKGYSWFNFCNEKYEENVRVFRVPIIPRGSGGNTMKILNYISFLFFSFLYIPKILTKKIDHIFIYAPSPVIHALIGIFLKKIFRVKLSIWLQDILTAVLSLKKKKSFLIFILDRVLKYIYKECDVIFVQSKKYIKYLKPIVSQKKIVYMPNLLISNNQRLNFKKIKNLNFKKFNIGYFGNIGEVQEFNTILKAATKIKNKNINFHFFGEGVKKNLIINQVKKKKLTNFFINDYVSFDQVLFLIKKFNVLFLSLKKNKILNLTSPSKMQLYLSSGKPIIGEINGECKRIIIESKSGIVIKSNDVKSMTNSLENLYKIRNTLKFKSYGKNGKKYFKKNFNEKMIIKTFYTNLSKII